MTKSSSRTSATVPRSHFQDTRAYAKQRYLPSMQGNTCICTHILRAAFRPTSFKSIPFPTPPIHRSTTLNQRTFDSTEDPPTSSQHAPSESSNSRESAGIPILAGSSTQINIAQPYLPARHSRACTAPPHASNCPHSI
jgi:hypothetical protein